MPSIKQLPYPMAGVSLAMAALGNALKPILPMARPILGTIAALIIILVISRMIVDHRSFIADFKKAPIAGVLATIPMTVSILATYLIPFSKTLATAIWLFAIVGHITLIATFSLHYLRQFKLLSVYPSWFVMYVGIVTATVTAPALQQIGMGTLCFWFGLTSYLSMLPFVAYRVLVSRQIPPPVMPTLAIFAAPASLLLAGYHALYGVNWQPLHLLLIALASLMYVIVITRLPKLLKTPPSPAYAAFTFPLVISAIALKPISAALGMPSMGSVLLLVASIAVIYVSVVYVRLLFAPVATAVNPS